MSNEHPSASLRDDFGRLADQLRTLAMAVPEAGMSATEEVVVKFLDRVDAGDVDGALSHCVEEVSYRIPGRSEISGTHNGADAVRAAFDAAPRVGAAELATTLQEVIASGPSVVSVHALTGSLDGRPVRYELILRFHMTGEKITSIAEYTDDQYLADDLFTTPPAAVADAALEATAAAVEPTTHVPARRPWWPRRRRSS